MDETTGLVPAAAAVVVVAGVVVEISWEWVAKKCDSWECLLLVANRGVFLG
jgi:hypothetical protein